MKIQECFQSSHSGQSFTVVGIAYFDTLEEKLKFIEEHKDSLHDGYCGFFGAENEWNKEGLYDGGGESEFEGHVVPIIKEVKGYNIKEMAVYFNNVAEQGYTINKYRQIIDILSLGETLHLDDN